MHSILLVEDSDTYQKIVLKTLAHHLVECAVDVDEALAKLYQKDFDLVLLDITLPKKNGYTLLAELRSNTKTKATPVICLTGKTEITDKVTAFSLGADDYLVKPFDPLELKARVDGKLARTKQGYEDQQILSIGNLEIDQGRHRVSIDYSGKKREVSLTQTEFKLLTCLCRKLDQVFTRDQLLVAAWGEDAEVLDRTVDVHLCSLRRKLKGIQCGIEAVPGVGYRMSLEKHRTSDKPQASKKVA